MSTTSPRRCAELVTEVTIEDLKRSGAFSALYLVLVLTGGFEPTGAQW